MNVQQIKSGLTFWKSDFLRNVSYQMVGTGLAQILPFAVSPILTRMYSESDFASYTSFFSIASILAIGAGGRYQFAIILPKSNREAVKVFSLSLYLTFIYSFLLFLAVLLFGTLHEVSVGVYFVPSYVLLFGIWNSFAYLSIRNRNFLQNAISKFLQSFFYVISALALGLLSYTLLGLIVAKTFGMMMAGIYLFKDSYIKLKYTKVNDLREIAKKFVDYPKYGLVPAFLDILSVQGIILILTKFYSTNDLGFFGLTYLVLNAPIGLIGTSFRDVFYQKINSFIQQNELKRSLKFFMRSALALFFAGLPISLIIYLTGPEIFSFVFGEKWMRSGEFASILSVSFLVQLVVSPLSSIFNAANKIKIASFWQSLYFVTTFLTLGISSVVIKVDVDTLLFIYVVHEIVLYSIYFVLQFLTLKKLN